MTFEEVRDVLLKRARKIYLEKGIDKLPEIKNRDDTDIPTINRKVQTPDDLGIDARDYLLVPELVLYKPDGDQVQPNFIPHQIEPMNDFYNGIKQIVTDIFKIEATILPENMHESDSINLSKIEVVVRYTNVELKKPIREGGGPLYPNEAIRMQRTYSGEMFVNAKIELKAYHTDGHIDEIKQSVKQQKLCRIPIAVKTALCNTYKKSREQLIQLHEDPDDSGGYFIIEGIEWIVDSLENVEFNSLRVYRNIGFKHEHARGEFISKGGDGYENSDQFIIRLLRDGQLTIEIKRSSRVDSMQDVHIPFYVLYRAMGWSSDKEIIENIIGAPIEVYQNDDSSDSEGDDSDSESKSKSTKSKAKPAPRNTSSIEDKDDTFVQSHTTMRQILKILKRAYDVSYDDFNGMRAVTDPYKVQERMITELVQTEKFKIRESKKMPKRADAVDAEADDEGGGGGGASTIRTKSGKRKMFRDTKISDDNRKTLRANLSRYFDIYFLEHVGVTPGARGDKLRELSNMILEVILTALECNPETGRDDYSTKRIHTNGKSLSKTFKTLFNLSAIHNTRSAIIKSIRNNPYKKLQLSHILRAQIYGQKFEQSLIRVIKQAKDTEIQVTARRSIQNRISAQLLNRKGNRLNKVAIQRQVNTPINGASKTSERAIQIRRYHNSGAGFICPISSPEGGKVGANKGLALTSQITSSGDSTILKTRIMKEPDFHPLGKVTPRMLYEKKLARIRVNGHCIGYVPNAYEFAIRYRSLRRSAKIDKHTSIVWDPRKNDIKLWVDDGRLVRPLIIVYNTWDDPEVFRSDPEVNKHLNKPLSERPFKQGVLLTHEDPEKIKSGQLIMDTLLREQVIEYITPAEQALNCIPACGPDLLQRYARDPTYRFTHLDFPQELLSITAMVAIYAHCNQTPRNVFQNNQAKHTAGEYSSVWPYRPDKNTYYQYINEYPIVATKINPLLPPSGMNTICDIMCYTGYNQEDSSIISRGAIDRGLWDCSKFTHYTVERANNKRHFKKPDASNTRDMNPDSFYGKLGPDGYTPVGTYVTKDDVLVAVLTDISADSKDQKYTYADRSLVYKSLEDGIVYNVIHGTKSDGTEFIRICLRIIREVVVGDKFSTRTGQKGICAFLYSDSDMPFEEDGTISGVIMNPHAIPTRMTCGDLFEKIAGNWAARKGVHADASMFFPHHIESYMKELTDMGENPYAKQRIYNGFEGEPINTPCLRGVTLFQRLLKFVMDSYQTNPDGPLDPLTRQPVAGKARDGGLRLGEMEKDCIITHGAVRFLMEKFSHHSDGHPIYICRNCRQFAVVNHRKKIYRCQTCRDKADISEVMSCWAAKAVLLEQQGMMINVELGLAPYAFDRYVTK